MLLTLLLYARTKIGEIDMVTRYHYDKVVGVWLFNFATQHDTKLTRPPDPTKLTRPPDPI